jgi:hypothetical protein
VSRVEDCGAVFVCVLTVTYIVLEFRLVFYDLVSRDLGALNCGVSCLAL